MKKKIIISGFLYKVRNGCFYFDIDNFKFIFHHVKKTFLFVYV